MLGIGGFECWYASGYTVMDHSRGNWNFTINGWVAAAVNLTSSTNNKKLGKVAKPGCVKSKNFTFCIIGN